MVVQTTTGLFRKCSIKHSQNICEKDPYSVVNCVLMLQLLALSNQSNIKDYIETELQAGCVVSRGGPF